MKIALIHDHYNNDHLNAVKNYMQKTGSVKIKAVWIECWDMYAAVEGCHRLRAAKELGITPEIVEVEYSDDMIDDANNESPLQISAICDDAWRSTILTF